MCPILTSVIQWSLTRVQVLFTVNKRQDMHRGFLEVRGARERAAFASAAKSVAAPRRVARSFTQRAPSPLCLCAVPRSRSRTAIGTNARRTSLTRPPKSPASPSRTGRRFFQLRIHFIRQISTSLNQISYKSSKFEIFQFKFILYIMINECTL